MGRKRRHTEPVDAPRLSAPHAWIIAAALAVLTFVVFAELRHAGFVQLDDPVYVSENPRLSEGLTPSAIGWAFTTFTNANWHPLTWISHLIDVQLFGLNGGAHHVVNVLLHAINAGLLFVLLWSMTGEAGRSAFVAALFAIHPLHVESVAWISERKDVLSTLFWLLTMAAYLRYVRRPSVGPFALVVATFALGLMAKPMLVTLPVVLLLLDVWPLKRLAATPMRTVALEKLPLLALSAASAVITVIAQSRGGAVMPLDVIPFGTRLANAVVAYATYLWKAIWPVDLAMFYPYNTSLGATPVAMAAAILVAITALAWRHRRQDPAPLIGWLWYLGTLVPVIGLVQVGRQAMADRYTYVPFIGLFIAIAWAGPRLRRSTASRLVTAGAAGAIVVACIAVTRAQVQHWQNNTTFWTRAIAVTLDVDPGHAERAVTALTEKTGKVSAAIAALFRVPPSEARRDLGAILLQAKQYADAEALLIRAVAERPDDALVHETLGRLRVVQGRSADAIDPLKRALAIDPARQQTQANLGRLLGQLGRLNEAKPYLAAAVAQDPSDAAARNDYGLVLATEGEFAAAMAQYSAALAIDATIPELFNNIGLLYAAEKRMPDAIDQFNKAVALSPDYVEALKNLGIAYITMGNHREAAKFFQRVLQLKPNDETARKGLEITGKD